MRDLEQLLKFGKPFWLENPPWKGDSVGRGNDRVVQIYCGFPRFITVIAASVMIKAFIYKRVPKIAR